MRLFIQLFFWVLTTSSFAIAQSITFTDVASLPTAKSALTSAKASDRIYVVNGFSESEQYTSEVYEYDTVQDSWSTLTDATIPKRFASAEIVGENLYVFNGVATGGLINSAVEKISLLDGTLEILTTNPAPVTNAGVVEFENKIYSFGGSTVPGQYSDKLYVFDPSDETWTMLSDMPRAGQVKGEVIDSKLYVIGGFNGSVSDQVDVYNFATDTWEDSINLPVSLSANVTAVVGKRLYTIGDFNAQGTVAYFDTETGTYTDLNNNLNNRRHGAAEVVNGVLYAIGGNTASDITTSTESVQRATVGVSSTAGTRPTQVKVFPNPTTGLLRLPKRYSSVRLYDLLGREVNSWTDVTSIDVLSLAPGGYRLQLEDGQKVRFSSFVKE